jgi:sugar/nucleoside kinase (ribokinase family)
MNQTKHALVIGGVALDEIALPTTHLTNVVGGSAVYGALASILFSPTFISGVYGSDFPQDYLKRLEDKGIETSFLKASQKASFRWSGKYSQDLASITNINESIGAFEDFKVPQFGKKKDLIAAAFIANNDPESQIEIMENLNSGTIKILDSMDLWVLDKRQSLMNAIKLADVLLINEAEAHLLFRGLTAVPDLMEKIMRLGPKVVIYKRGEHGVVMYGRLGTLVVPSYPLSYAIDPSGAGDVFGGALAGVLSRFGTLDERSIKTAVLLASITSSFVVENYATDGIIDVHAEEVKNRANLFFKTMPCKEMFDLSILA